ncbi:hypothetical protein [Tenacibaculum piscium]|uniref:hypothetical protein n=1 Tax=Tenacibaculum piscium TaxID=1458515 RepID=UPI001F1B65CF|nr:hypothetical protein [Tenacibaculum piscium]
MAKIKSKKEALDKLNNLSDNVVIRIAELSENKTALGYFENAFQFAILKGFLK